MYLKNTTHTTNELSFFALFQQAGWICENFHIQPQAQSDRIKRTEAIADDLVYVQVQTEGGPQKRMQWRNGSRFNSNAVDRKGKDDANLCWRGRGRLTQHPVLNGLRIHPRAIFATESQECYH